MKHIIAYECHTRIPIIDNEFSNGLTREQSVELERLIETKKLNKKYVHWGRNYVVFINYVGFIQLSDVSIEILPKCTISVSESEGYRDSREILLHMLCRIGYLNIKISDLSLLKRYGKSLYEFFGALFASHLEQELKQGVMKNYLPAEEQLAFQRGRVVLAKQMPNLARRTGRVHCVYEEFELQHLLNVVLKSAVQLMLYRIQNIDTRKRLRKCDLMLGGIELQPFSKQQMESVQFNRLSKRYETSFQLAKMLLHDQSPFPQRGADKSFAILFAMEDVYEKYIALLLRENINQTIHTKHRKYKLLVNENTNKQIYSLEPDLVVEEQGHAVLIMDTKWKKIIDSKSRHGLKREDLFQMYTYVTRYPEARAAVLLYPHHDDLSAVPGMAVERWHVECHEHKKIRMYSLDLSSESNTVENLRTIVSEYLNQMI